MRSREPRLRTPSRGPENRPTYIYVFPLTADIASIETDTDNPYSSGGGATMKVTKYLVLMASVTALLVQGSALPAGAGSRNSPSGQVEIVTINLEEAYSQDPSNPRGGDLTSHFEIPNFVDRVLSETPHLPDALLVQEVNYETSGLLARELSRRSNQRYVVAVRPSKTTTVEKSDRQIHTETAIILNAATMKVAKSGGYYAAQYPRSAGLSGARVQVTRHAYILAEERGSGVRVPLVSLHFPNAFHFRTEKLSNYWRGQWTKALGRTLERRYNAVSRNDLTNFGGDFNAKACYRGAAPRCSTPAAYWRVLTSSPYKYEDPLLHRGIDGVDRIMTDGVIVEADWDRDGEFAPSDRARFYSDHRFRWSVVSER